MALDGFLRQQRGLSLVRQLFISANDLLGREILVGSGFAIVGRQPLLLFAESAGIHPRVLAYRFVTANLEEQPIGGIRLVARLLLPTAFELSFDEAWIDLGK